MDIFADDQTNTNQKELSRRAIAEAGGAAIGSAAATEKGKRSRTERAESNASMQAQLTALQLRLQDPDYLALYTRVSNKLDETQTELDRAILQNAEEIERLEANAARTDEGKLIFRTGDGNFVFADGAPVAGSDRPSSSSLPDSTTSWSEYRSAKEREAELARIQTQIIDPIRGRLQDQDDPISLTELEGFEGGLDRAMQDIQSQEPEPIPEVSTQTQVADIGFSFPEPAQ